uniref:Protein TIC 20 n=1 Tax=Noctiluca scintillans TaxID=2966 RepID=A0A7S1B1L4_NOCSC|mmetsp:Transcript_9135/g.25491  ORF Transcript_9135/g.25491 Transcript_9135/m.25491 type:complete len:272 (+) Transcript_9135:70-885(+)
MVFHITQPCHGGYTRTSVPNVFLESPVRPSFCGHGVSTPVVSTCWRAIWVGGAAVHLLRAKRVRVLTCASSADDPFYASLRRELGRLERGERAADAKQSRSTKRVRRRRPAPWGVRFVAACCLLLPLVAVTPYGSSLFAQFPMLWDFFARPQLLLLRFYHVSVGSRLADILCAALLYSVVGKNRSLHSLINRTATQSSKLMMLFFPVSFVLRFLASAPRVLANLVQSGVFVYFLCCIALGARGCVTGMGQRMPGIGDGSLMRTRFFSARAG